MAQKQDPPKKLMAPKGTMTSPSRKNTLERIDRVIKRSIKPKPMGLKTDSASNMVKSLTSPKAKAMRDSTLKAYVAKTGKMPMGLKVDSTKKVTPIGGSKPSVMIKKQTTVKPANPVKLLKNK